MPESEYVKNLNKYSRIFFGIVAVLIPTSVLIYLLITLFINQSYVRDICEEEKRVSYSGVVSLIQTDSLNPAQKFIYLSNGYKILTPFTYGLWNELYIGDSVVKFPHSLNYIIYRAPSFKIKTTLDWDRPCE